ncbi:hypothetical protein [Devosia sp. 2618]|uniref:hypothetical protein n=1 Tax=Devosia sp. 2618 TaxID=3156454 RepID=UPI003397A2A6
MAKLTTPTKLIVVIAFVRDDEGELQPAFEPREVQSEDKAKYDARMLAASNQYAGVIAWWRSADLVNGVFGDPVVLHQWGDIPEME